MISLKTATLVALIGNGINAAWGIYRFIEFFIANIRWNLSFADSSFVREIGELSPWSFAWQQLPYLVADFSLFVFFLALYIAQQKRN